MSDHATPGNHQGPGDPVSVTLPGWLATDWGIAATIAVRAVVTFLVVGVFVLLATLLILLIRFGASSLDIESLIATVLALPLLYLGSLQGSPVLLTGILVLVFALRRAVRASVIPNLDDQRPRFVALSGKVGLVVVGMLLIVAIVLDVLNAFPTTGLGGGLGLVQGFAVDYVRLLFVTGPVVALSSLVVTSKALNHPLWRSEVFRWPAAASSSWFGLKRTLKIALVGLLVLFALGTALETLTVDFGDFGVLAEALISLLLLVVVFVAVDVATLLFVGAMSFLQFESMGADSVWMWAGVVLVAVAFFIGGRTAAEKAHPASVTQSVASASLVGVLLSGIGILVAINYQGLANLQGFAGPAILLPLLWTLPALAGAWWYASERGLPSGVVVSVADTPSSVAATLEAAQPAVPAAEDERQTTLDNGETGEDREVVAASWPCGKCGADNADSHAFCSSCGTPRVT